MKKKTMGLFLTVVLTVLVALSGCSAGDSTESAAESIPETTETETTEAETTVEETESTEETVEETAETVSDEEIELEGAANMEDAPEITLGTKILGHLESSSSGDIKWYCFTTNSASGTAYDLAIGKDSSKITVSIYDERSNELLSQETESGGLTTYITLDSLEPGTRYYLRLSVGSYQSKEYSVSIDAADVSGTSSDISDAESTADTVSTVRATESDLDVETEDASTEIRLGTNQDDAILMPLETVIRCELDANYSWCRFTTSDNVDADYQITIIHKGLSNYPLYAVLCDEYGTELASGSADTDGLAVTFSCGTLSPNTTYYIRLISNNGPYHIYSVSIAVIVRDLNSTTSGIATSNNGGIVQTTDEIATNQDDAILISTGEKYESSTQESYCYYAFTASVSGEYMITMTDKSTEYGLTGRLYDKYGTELASGKADTDGMAATFSYTELVENETYYVRFDSHNGPYHPFDINYSFIIRGPETVEETEEEELIFSTPYEINATQVQFVINSAEFIDEEAAKEAVEPVAEALLAYPEHSILIAGTTATDGTQESCVKLSERRAAAVKNLLVKEFGVPESQIETIGLGYEADPFERGQDREVEGDLTSKFVESEGKKNRRVVIMDIDSEIAQEILATNG